MDLLSGDDWIDGLFDGEVKEVKKVEDTTLLLRFKSLDVGERVAAFIDAHPRYFWGSILTPLIALFVA